MKHQPSIFAVGKTKFMRQFHFLVNILAWGCICYAGALSAQIKEGSYRLCDFHQHTTFSDGEHSLGYDFQACDSIDLAWWANSEHGGPAPYNGLVSGKDKGQFIRWTAEQIKGDVTPDEEGQLAMWRWQTLSEYSFPEIIRLRKQVYPKRTLIQGVEWNVPGHEHASVTILDGQFDTNPHCTPLAEFEYKFDSRDHDIQGGKARGWQKSTNKEHAKALEGIAWLKEHHPQSSWVIPAHPDRKSRWTIADFREMNDLAPEICFGFEGIPGHQRSKDRGEYAPRNNTYGTYTYGGAGLMIAKVGGLWDSLLSEGRHWWLFTCSDFHNMRSDFLPGEYNKTYLYLPDKIEPMRLADYLRSGNCFVVSGNFIRDLRFELNGSKMGQTLKAKKGEPIVVDILLTENSDSPVRLDHVDLIAGEVHPKAQPGSEAYQCDSVGTTRVIARFTEKEWTREANGQIHIQYKIKPTSSHTYYRLRGTHHAIATPGETDQNGNPLPDNGINTEDKAMNDQWFYTNPIFCEY